jgi:biotin operon repressor
MLPDSSTTVSFAASDRRHRNRRPEPSPTEAIVLNAIRARGTRNFTGSEIAREAGVCRQTVYKVIHKLNGQGHRIEGTPRLGFMARLSFVRAAG